MLKGGVWAGLGLGPEEMKATAASRPCVSQQLSLEGGAHSFPRKTLLLPNIKLHCALPVENCLQNREFEAVLGDCYCIRHSDSTFWKNKKKENL